MILFFFLQGLQGEIKHLYRSFAFLSSKMVIENGGIIVCRTKHLVLAGGGKVKNVKCSLLVAVNKVIFGRLWVTKYCEGGMKKKKKQER